MDLNKKMPSIEEVKEIDLVGYLSKLGYEQNKISNTDYWYLSPLRNERTPSFKVNKKINKWYDHGLGKGGNIIDFGILYYQCSVSEFLSKFGTVFSFRQPVLKGTNLHETEPKITILQDFAIGSLWLVKYMAKRKIPIAIAEQYCREIRYSLNNKNYYGIGFKNDEGGYEIRNQYFKASSSPKDITTFNNNAKEVIVFEGFIDFLSFMAMHQNKPQKLTDFVVLNSLSFFEKARPFMEQHEAIRLYLDRDKAGQNCSRYAMLLGNKYKDESHLYEHHKDLNEWLVNNDDNPKQRHRLKLLLGNLSFNSIKSLNR